MSPGREAPICRAAPWLSAISLLLAAGLSGACGHSSVTGPSDGPDGGRPTLADVTAAQWQRLAGRKLFFGHQSVGGNILSGVRAVLADNPQIQLHLVTSRDPAAVSGGALVDASVGSNGNTASKLSDFASIVGRGLGAGGGVAMYKFCYVDVGAGTDVAALLAQHQATMASIRAGRPDVTIVHITMPLMTATASGVDAEAKRVEYNRSLVAAYEDHEPVFDLGKVESTHADGTRSYVMRGTDQVFTLADEWSADGGHLNPAGSRHVGEQFLIFLARL